MDKQVESPAKWIKLSDKYSVRKANIDDVFTLWVNDGEISNIQKFKTLTQLNELTKSRFPKEHEVFESVLNHHQN